LTVAFFSGGCCLPVASTVADDERLFGLVVFFAAGAGLLGLADFLAADFFMWTPQRELVCQQAELEQSFQHELGFRPALWAVHSPVQVNPGRQHLNVRRRKVVDVKRVLLNVTPRRFLDPDAHGV